MVNLAYQIGGKFLSVEYANGLYRSDKIGSALSAELIGNTWTPERTDAYFPMVMYGNTYGDGATIGSWAYTDMALFDSSYLNVKNITLGYSLPKIFSANSAFPTHAFSLLPTTYSCSLDMQDSTRACHW